MKRVIIGLILLTAITEASRNGGAIHSISIASPLIIIAAFFRAQIKKLKWSEMKWLSVIMIMQLMNFTMWIVLGTSRIPAWKNELTLLNLIAMIVFFWLVFQDWSKVK